MGYIISKSKNCLLTTIDLGQHYDVAQRPSDLDTAFPVYDDLFSFVNGQQPVQTTRYIKQEVFIKNERKAYIYLRENEIRRDDSE